MLVQKRRNKHAAIRLLRKLLKNQAIRPRALREACAMFVLRNRRRPSGYLKRTQARPKDCGHGIAIGCHYDEHSS